jgi:hypothetical protein
MTKATSAHPGVACRGLTGPELNVARTATESWLRLQGKAWAITKANHVDRQLVTVLADTALQMPRAAWRTAALSTVNFDCPWESTWWVHFRDGARDALRDYY